MIATKRKRRLGPIGKPELTAGVLVRGELIDKQRLVVRVPDECRDAVENTASPGVDLRTLVIEELHVLVTFGVPARVAERMEFHAARYAHYSSSIGRDICREAFLANYMPAGDLARLKNACEVFGRCQGMRLAPVSVRVGVRDWHEVVGLCARLDVSPLHYLRHRAFAETKKIDDRLKGGAA